MELLNLRHQALPVLALNHLNLGHHLIALSLQLIKLELLQLLLLFCELYLGMCSLLILPQDVQRDLYALGS